MTEAKRWYWVGKALLWITDAEAEAYRKQGFRVVLYEIKGLVNDY